MPRDFVRYTPDIETLDPRLDELLPQIIEFWEKKVRESPKTEGTGRAVRGAHAKTYGLVRAELQILRNVPEAYAQGIYATPGRHGVLLRFSSASNHLGPDAQLGPVLGCAIKIFDVRGGSWSRTSRTRPRSTSSSRTTRSSSPGRRTTICGSRRSATTPRNISHEARRGSTSCLRTCSRARGRSNSPTGRGRKCSRSCESPPRRRCATPS